MTLERSTDEELMIKYQAGEYYAFEELFKRHSKKVFSFLGKRLSNKEEAEDLFQQVFSKFHQSKHTYSPQYAFTQWLFVVAKSVLLDHWCKENRRIKQTAAYIKASEVESQENSNDNTSLPESITATLSSLPTHQRQALELRVMDELSYAEISKRLKYSEANVRQLVSRAIRKIRQSINTPKGGQQ